MTELLGLAIIIFLLGVLSFAYGMEVNNEFIQNVMGLMTLICIAALTVVVVIAVFT